MRIIRHQIDADVLRAGSRVPSVREMSERTGFSAVTIHHAYVELEAEGILFAKPRSGFYVAERIRKLSEFSTEESDLDTGQQSAESAGLAFYKISMEWQKRNLAPLGLMNVSEDLFPHKELGTHYLKEIRRTISRPPAIASSNGEKRLREAITRRATLRGMSFQPSNVIVTRSARYALNLCLEATTKPGDLVLVETPSYPPLFAALGRRQLQVIEIYSHPSYGIDPDQFDYLMDKNDIRVCAMMPMHHFPTGVSYSEETLRRILAKAVQKNTPIIENDAYGELSYGESRRRTLFHLDEHNIVLQFGTFLEYLGSRFGFGWILSRAMHDRLSELHFLNDPAVGTDSLQGALAEFMQKRSYDRHMRFLRDTLNSRMQRGISLISEHFPQECAVSRADGGFMCWIRAPRGFDAMAATSVATKAGVSYAPGPLFSMTNSFKNFLALNLSFEWTPSLTEKLILLADLVSQKRLRN